MKNILIALLFTSSFFYSGKANHKSSQEQDIQKSYSEAQIRAFVDEVYGAAAEKQVYKNEQRFKMIKRFFNNIEISYHENLDVNKTIPNILDLTLIDKFRQNLQYDRHLSDPTQFNPLKYDLKMFPLERTIYRIGNTKYILAISPQ